MEYENAVYSGPNEMLIGKGAIVVKQREGVVKAQFNDLTSPYAHGWHLFREDEFTIYPTNTDPA